MAVKKKVVKKKNKLGAPSTFKKKYCEELIEHMASGLSFETFAALVNANRDTVFAWAKQHKIFSDAKKIGEMKCQLFWESLGRAGSAGKINGFNCGAWVFNMKNRCKWRDRHEVSGDVYGSLKVIVDSEDAEL